MCSSPACIRRSHVSRSGVSSPWPLIPVGLTIVSRSPMIGWRRRSLSALLRLYSRPRFVPRLKFRILGDDVRLCEQLVIVSADGRYEQIVLHTTLKEFHSG